MGGQSPLGRAGAGRHGGLGRCRATAGGLGGPQSTLSRPGLGLWAGMRAARPDARHQPRRPAATSDACAAGGPCEAHRGDAVLRAGAGQQPRDFGGGRAARLRPGAGRCGAGAAWCGGTGPRSNAPDRALRRLCPAERTLPPAATGYPRRHGAALAPAPRGGGGSRAAAARGGGHGLARAHHGPGNRAPAAAGAGRSLLLRRSRRHRAG